MDLREGAYWTKQSAGDYLVIEDVPLMEWAAEQGSLPKDAQIAALEQGIVPLRYIKNFTALNLEEQIGICRSRVLVCGCGGLGGVVISLLARAGVGFMRLLDGDVFAPSNLNRQWFSQVEQLGRPKARVAREGVHRINPFVEVEAFDTPLGTSNAEQLLHGMDLSLDALDNLPGRFLLAETCCTMGIAFVHAAVSGWWGQISTFLPGTPAGLEKIYGTKRSRDPEEDALGVLGPTASVIGSLETLEAMRILAGREAAYANKLLYFDGESGQMSVIPL